MSILGKQKSSNLLATAPDLASANLSTDGGFIKNISQIV